jgi:hypothetical protein
MGTTLRICSHLREELSAKIRKTYKAKISSTDRECVTISGDKCRDILFQLNGSEPKVDATMRSCDAAFDPSGHRHWEFEPEAYWDFVTGKAVCRTGPDTIEWDRYEYFQLNVIENGSEAGPNSDSLYLNNTVEIVDTGQRCTLSCLWTQNSTTACFRMRKGGRPYQARRDNRANYVLLKQNDGSDHWVKYSGCGR